MSIQSFRRMLLKPKFPLAQNLCDKNIVVTGVGYDSLGFATATLLAQWGANVIATSRAAQPALQHSLQEKAGKGQIRLLPLDLCESTSVEQFSEQVVDTFGNKLDVLINCAGIHLDLMSKWKQAQRTDDGFEIHWRTNYLGTVQLTEQLLPALLNAAADSEARIVNVSSMLHTRGSNQQLWSGAQPYNSWVAYGLSKLALMHYTYELQRRHAQKGLQSYCLHPGAINTPIANKGLATSPVAQAFTQALSPLQSLFMLSPEEGAQTQIMCATTPDLLGGRYYRNCKQAMASADLQDDAVAQRLWDETQQWLAGQ